MKKTGLAAVLIGVFFFLSCSGKVGLISDSYGKVKASRDVTASFQDHRIKEDHTYYTSGPDSYPNAMIGVDERYILVSDLWKERDLTPKTMKILVENMRSKAGEYGSLLHGFDILDDKGNDIGDRYSILSLSTTIKILGGNKISISTPPVDIYEHFKIKMMSPDVKD